MLRLSIYLLALISFSSCATILSKSDSPGSIRSQPASAEIIIDGQRKGTTPMEVRLETKKSHSLEFRKSGYESRTILINSSTGAGWVILDFVLGIMPVVVD